MSFVTDVYSRRIVGWNVASAPKAAVSPLQALEIVAWQSGGNPEGLVHHSDHGSNYMSIVHTNWVVELGVIPSTGPVGDKYDNSIAEAVNALYKTERIRQQAPCTTVEQVELAKLKYAWCGTTSDRTGNSICVPRQKRKRRTMLTLNRCRKTLGYGQTGRN